MNQNACEQNEFPFKSYGMSKNLLLFCSLPMSTADPEERTRRLQERRKAKKLAREHYSLRMTALYKLSVANHFRDNTFWLPLNLDFRGRVYPIPPHCSHIGKSSRFISFQPHTKKGRHLQQQSRTQTLLTFYGACSMKTKGSGKDRF